jgi:glucose/arabinose dehydrogenase
MRIAMTGVDPRRPNAPDQKPAFAGQTRAPERKANVAFDVVTSVKGLENPWAVAFLPSGKMLVTEKPGRLRVAAPDGKLSEPVAGLPAVDARSQGGRSAVCRDRQHGRPRAEACSEAVDRFAAGQSFN